MSFARFFSCKGEDWVLIGFSVFRLWVLGRVLMSSMSASRIPLVWRSSFELEIGGIWHRRPRDRT